MLNTRARLNFLYLTPLPLRSGLRPYARAYALPPPAPPSSSAPRRGATKAPNGGAAAPRPPGAPPPALTPLRSVGGPPKQPSATSLSANPGSGGQRPPPPPRPQGADPSGERGRLRIPDTATARPAGLHGALPHTPRNGAKPRRGCFPGRCTVLRLAAGGRVG